MTALKNLIATPFTAAEDMFSGADTGLFTKSAGPDAASLLGGDQVQLFTTSAGPEAGRAVTDGAQTALFSSGS